MVYRTFTPPSPLDAFVENLWYWEGSAPGHGKDTIMASGRVGLSINLVDDHFHWYDGDGFARRHRACRAVIAGPNSEPFAVDAFHRAVMGVQFRAGGAFPFFAPPVHEFHNRHVALDDLWGADSGSLHQRLVEAPTVDGKFAILSQTLLDKIHDPPGRHPAVAQALDRFARAPHRASVAATARAMDISPKRFIRLFRDEVGLTPKRYLRVARFQRILARLSHAPQVDWGDAVEQGGYYDQSHFIREFRAFSGLSPSDYLKCRGPYLQHVPLPA